MDWGDLCRMGQGGAPHVAPKTCGLRDRLWPCWKPSESVRSFGLSWANCSPRYADFQSCATALLLALLLAGHTV
jgi:hypothetical protein